jgi:hypothetical protein
VDKTALRQAILAQLEAELVLQTEAAHHSRDEATDADSRAEGKFDMRAQSAAYLAAGQANLAVEIGEAIVAYQALPLRAWGEEEAIAVGAAVTLEARGERTVYFLGPLRGGMVVEIAGASVTVITASSALGRLMLGRKKGATVAVPRKPTPIFYRVAEVE